MDIAVVLRAPSWWPSEHQKLNRAPNWKARGKPVPVGIDGRTAERLPNPEARFTPPRTRSPVAVNNPPSGATLNPAGALPSEAAAMVVNVPLNGLDGRPPAPTRLEIFRILNT